MENVCVECGEAIDEGYTHCASCGAAALGEEHDAYMAELDGDGMDEDDGE